MINQRYVELIKPFDDMLYESRKSLGTRKKYFEARGSSKYGFEATYVATQYVYYKKVEDGKSNSHSRKRTIRYARSQMRRKRLEPH